MNAAYTLTIIEKKREYIHELPSIWKFFCLIVITLMDEAARRCASVLTYVVRNWKKTQAQACEGGFSAQYIVT